MVRMRQCLSVITHNINSFTNDSVRVIDHKVRDSRDSKAETGAVTST